MIETPEPGSVADRAQRVLVAHGRAPNIVRALNDEERTVLAALWQDGTPAADGVKAVPGQLVEGSAEAYREAMVKFGERMEKEKATVDEDADGEWVMQNEVFDPNADNPQPSAGRE